MTRNKIELSMDQIRVPVLSEHGSTLDSIRILSQRWLDANELLFQEQRNSIKPQSSIKWFLQMLRLASTLLMLWYNTILMLVYSTSEVFEDYVRSIPAKRDIR